MMIKTPFYLAFLLFGLHVVGQDNSIGQKAEYINFPWKKVSTQMPDEWYATTDAKKVAENVLFCQQNIGGWAKNKPYHHSLTAADSAEVIKIRPGIGATIDNGATTMEMIFLAKVYSASQDERYYQAFHKALNYLLEAQYGNGGWPQFFPFRKGSYASHITYNDNAIVNVLNLLRDISQSKPPYAALPITADMKAKAGKAYEKGIECILKTQIIVNGQPTVWCAQHDENTLLPANARAYELASFSGAESVGILQLLMEIDNPSEEIVTAVVGGMKWLDEHKLTGIKVENNPGAEGKKNMVVVEDPNAPPLLARFYDLETGKPFFCDRDGIKKSSLPEIGYERRNGYSWYSSSFEGLKKKYDKWVGEWKVELQN